MHKNKFHLVIIALSSLVLITSCKDDVDPATFSLDGEIAITNKREGKIELDVLRDDIQKLELFMNDSLLKSWNSPKIGKVSYMLQTAPYGVGEQELALKVVTTNGETYSELRLLRVLSDIIPEIWSYEIIADYPHSISNFTQGLEFNDGQLYESTGQKGESKVAKIDLMTGKDIANYGLDATHFGEGITVLGDKVYQITWQTGRCFTYDKNTLQPLNKDFSYSGEGWGLCNDGKNLIMSDGSEVITFRDPENFSTIRTIKVYKEDGPVTNLNELEYIDGLIYANVWMSNSIVVIDPKTGCVVAAIDGSKLVTAGRGQIGEAFNGIAYNPADGLIYLTGKRWNKLFKVRILKSGLNS